MKDVRGQVELIVRRLGMNRVGSIGKSILVDMVLIEIDKPFVSYEEVLSSIQTRDTIIRVNRKDLICDTRELSDLECCVLKVIEELESHKYEEDGRKVIQEWIEKITKEYYKNSYYEKVIQRVIQYGLDPSKNGTNLITSMVYKRYIVPQISEDNLYQYIIHRIDPEIIKRWKKENNKIPVEIIDGSNRHQRVIATHEFIRRKINALIFEAIQESDELRDKKTVMEIVEALLENI